MKKAIVSVVLVVVLLLVGLSSVIATTGTLYVYPKFRAWSTSGAPLVGGKLYSYKPGTSTPKALYTDRELTTPATNPLILDSNGEAAIWGWGFYKFILKTAAGVTLWTMDNVMGLGGGSGGDFDDIINYDDNLCFAVSTIGATTQKTLIIGHPITETVGCTVTANITLWLPDPGTVTVSNGKTVTDLGVFLADQKQKFPGTGTWTFLGGIQTDVLADWWGSTTGSILLAWNAINTGTVNLTEGVTYTGNLTLEHSTTYRKRMLGYGSKISGNLVVNESKMVTVEGVEVNGHGEINGCQSCRWKGIDILESGQTFSPGSTKRSNHYLLITDMPSDGNTTLGFGTWWTTVEDCRHYGTIIAPAAYGATHNNGINRLTITNTRSQGCESSGDNSTTDCKGAGVRIVSTGGSGSEKSEANVFEGGDLSDNTYAVLNETTDWPFKVRESYVEQFHTANSGPVVWDSNYIYTVSDNATETLDDNTTITGRNDMAFSFNAWYSSLSRGRYGGMMLPINEIYGNPFFTNLKYNSSVGTYIPIGLGLGDAALCGDENGSTIEMVEDSATPTKLVLHATGPTDAGEKCSLRFSSLITSYPSDGHLSAVVIARGSYHNSKIGYSGGEHNYTFLNGSIGSSDYTILFGSESLHNTADSGKPYVELTLGVSDEIWISNVNLCRGKVCSAEGNYIPHERTLYTATSNDAPTVGNWQAYDHARIEGSLGSRWAWMATEDGNCDSGSCPEFAGIGQIGYRESAASPVGVATPKHAMEMYFDNATDDWYMATGATSADWKAITSTSTAPSGSSTLQVLFNKSGAAIGDDNLTYDDSTKVLTAAGSVSTPTLTGPTRMSGTLLFDEVVEATLAANVLTLGAGNIFKVDSTGTPITTIAHADSTEGRMIVLKNANATPITLTHNGNCTDHETFFSSTGANVTLNKHDTITLYQSGGCWRRADYQTRGEQQVSETTISLGADGNTTIYTVPSDRRFIPTKAILVAAADAGTSTITIGQAGALTDFLGTQTLSNVDAQYDAAILMPVPNATPVKIKSYAAGTTLKAVVGSHAGSAGNTLYLFGMLN